MFCKKLLLCSCALAVILSMFNSAQAVTIWIDDTAGNIGTVDLTTGAVNVIGNSGQQLTDIAFDPSGNLWGLDFTQLYRINTTTGHATSVGSGTNLSGGNALVFGKNGTLYAGGGTDHLYTIDTTTGLATSIGTINAVSAGDLAFNTGGFYLSDVNNKLVSITLSPSVSGTEIGSIGYSNVFGLATASDGVLYGLSGTRIFAVNTATGAGGPVIVDYAGHGLLGANGSSFITEAPEPSTFLLAAIGLVALAFRLRRR